MQKMKIKHLKKRTVIILIIIIITVLGGLSVYFNLTSDESCRHSPNGCPPPGMCNAPNDGYISCDRLNKDGNFK